MAVNPWTALYPAPRLENPTIGAPWLKVIYWHTDWSLAVAYWDGSRAMLIRWNGGPGPSRGNPVSRSYPTWFVVPDALVPLVLKDEGNPNRAMAAAWLSGQEPEGWTDPVPHGFGDQ